MKVDMVVMRHPNPGAGCFSRNILMPVLLMQVMELMNIRHRHY